MPTKSRLLLPDGLLKKLQRFKMTWMADENCKMQLRTEPFLVSCCTRLGAQAAQVRDTRTAICARINLRLEDADKCHSIEELSSCPPSSFAFLQIVREPLIVVHTTR